MTIGKYYREHVLVEPMRFCQRHKLHLILDEIHAVVIKEGINR